MVIVRVMGEPSPEPVDTFVFWEEVRMATNFSNSLTAQSYDDVPLTSKAPTSNLVKTSMVPGGKKLGEKLQNDLENLKAGESLFIPKGTYHLSDWTNSWDAPDRPLQLVGEPGSLLVLPDNGFNGLVYLRNNIKIWDVDFQGPSSIFRHVDKYMDHAHFYDVDTINVTELFTSGEGIRTGGPAPDDDKVREVVFLDSTAIGNGPGTGTTNGLIKMTANFDAVLLGNIQSENRAAPLVYTGYEFSYDEGNEGPVHWRGPDDPDGPDQSGHGNTYLLDVTMSDFTGRGYNAVSLRYNNVVLLDDVVYETDDAVRGDASEAIYIKAREVWGSGLTIRNGTNNQNDTEGAIAIKRGIAYLENVDINNNWQGWTSGDVGRGVVAHRAVIDLWNTAIANAAKDTWVTSDHTFFGISESEAKQRLEQQFPDFDFITGRPKLRRESGDGSELSPSIDSASDSGSDGSGDSSSDGSELAIDGFVLVDAGADQRVGAIGDGDVLTLSDLGFDSFSVVAETSGDVDNVKLALKGPVTAYATEGLADYSLFGDSNGDYVGETLLPGDYTLTAKPYAGNGAEGKPFTIAFTVAEGNAPVADTGADGSAGGITKWVVSASDDDVEQSGSGGGVNLTSDDLEIGRVDDYSVGLRFTGHAVPQGATITGAHLEFKAEADDTGAAEIEIALEETAAAAQYSDAATVTERSYLDQTVLWSAPSFQKGETYQSADLAPLLNNLLEADGVAPSDALAFELTTSAGSDQRSLYSFDGDDTPAALIIEYTTDDAFLA